MKDVFSIADIASGVLPENGVVVMNRENEVLVRVNCEAQEVPEEGPAQVTCDLYKVKGKLTYASLVDAVVRDKYSQDEVEAIVLNHLANSKEAEHKAQYEALQAWRTEAKAIAKVVLGEEA